MDVTHLWSGLLNFIMSLGFALAFYGAFTSLITTQDTGVQIFLGVITALVFFTIIILDPASKIISDDTGRNS